jgi:hypothetical protein
MWHITQMGTSDERRALIKELMENNVLEIILDVCALLPHRFFFRSTFWTLLCRKLKIIR